MTRFTLPTSWVAEPYPTHHSFAYERPGRDDYDFRVEFTDGVPAAEQEAVIALIEAAPELLAFALNVRAACAVQANLNSTASEADRSRFISDVYRLWNTDGIAATDKVTGKDTA